jgi:diacylglycerol kinase
MESKGKKSDEFYVKNTEKLTKRKRDFSIKAIWNVIKYSFEGYIHFYKYERSAILHLVVAVAIILGSFSLDMKAVEWLFMIFILLVMMAIELLNTAIEAICDLVSPEYNRYVKIAKDTASAATFSISLALVAALLIIYVPKIAALLGF